MKKVGIVGGMGPASTIDYYRDICQDYRLEFGDDRYPEIVIDSVDMHGVVEDISAGRLEAVGDAMVRSIENLAGAGADFAAIASNSPHIAWDYIEGRAAIPVVSIIEAVCGRLKAEGYRRTLIFGTVNTMKNGLYSNALESRGLGWALPEPEDIEELGGIIYPNLENGLVVPEDKRRMIAIAEKYIAAHGCDCLLLGCTEIPLMIKPGDVSVPVANTARIHIETINRLIRQ